MDTQLPSPVVLAAQLGRVIEAAGLPTDVFVGLPPEPADAGRRPTQQAAERIAAGARGSHAACRNVACGKFYTGTAFAVSANHFVTNAHVVAGSDKVWLSFDGSLDRHRRVTSSMFDPELDAAGWSTRPTSACHVLPMAAAVPQRGRAGRGDRVPRWWP